MLFGDGLATVEGWARQYGDIFFWRAFGLPFCYLTHPDHIEQVLVTRNQDFVKGVSAALARCFSAKASSPARANYGDGSGG